MAAVLAAKLPLQVIALILGLVLFPTCNGFSYELTVEVLPGKVECFYQPMEVTGEKLIEVDYQVIEGGDGDINFGAKDPAGNVIISDQRVGEGTHEISVHQMGPYAFCFDNSFSIVSSKVVYFELFSEEPDEEQLKRRKELNDLYDTQISAEKLYEISVGQIKDILASVKRNLEKIVQDQHSMRNTHRKDRSVQEHNYERVNYLSAFYLGLMVAVGLLQVYMIRQLFSSRITGSGSMKAAT